MTSFRLVFTPSNIDAPLEHRLQSFAAVHVIEARVVGTVLSALSSFPLPHSVSHIKRVKKDAEGGGALVLLCESSRLTELGVSMISDDEGGYDVDISSPLSNAILAAGVGASKRIQIVSVVSEPPSDRIKSDAESLAIWPMVFAPRAAAVAATARMAASRAPTHVAQYFAEGLRAAERAAAHGGVNSGVAFFAPPSLSTIEGSGAKGGGGQIILRAEGAASRDGHPFRTAVLSAIAILADKDRAARKKDDDDTRRRLDSPEMRASEGVKKRAREIDDNDGVGEGVDVDIPNTTVATNNSSGNSIAAESGGTTTTNTNTNTNTTPTLLTSPQPPTMMTTQYLLTGCDAFLTHEPGLMDAMALVHARVSRVIFARPSTCIGRGAFLCAMPIHEARGMNHRYLVYTVESVVE